MKKWLFGIIIFLFLAPGVYGQQLNPGSVDEFLQKRGFTVEKDINKLCEMHCEFEKRLADGKLILINVFFYIRGVTAPLFKQSVVVFEYDNPKTPNDEMIGDIVFGVDYKTQLLVDFRKYDSKTKTKHIWYEGNQPVPSLPDLVDNSLY